MIKTFDENYGFGNKLNPGIPASFSKKQVHGVNCVQVNNPSQHCGDADAFWTEVPGLVLSVVTADCVPIILARKDGKAVGAIHAGWRGTYANIGEAFFKGKDPAHWKAFLGPSIHACCYEVSEALMQDFKQKFSFIPPKLVEPKHRHLDLTAINIALLKQCGVSEIEVHPDCTYCTLDSASQPLYFSYRRGDREARQYSWIGIKE